MHELLKYFVLNPIYQTSIVVLSFLSWKSSRIFRIIINNISFLLFLFPVFYLHFFRHLDTSLNEFNFLVSQNNEMVSFDDAIQEGRQVSMNSFLPSVCLFNLS